MLSRLSTVGVTVKSSTGYKLLCLFLLFYLFLFQYCRIKYFADPTSYFFDPKRAYAPGYSAQRKHEAANFITQESNFPFRRSINDTKPKLCIGIASIAREGVHYLHYSTGSLLHGLSEAERQQIVLITLLAHANSTKHPDSKSTWLQNTADQVLDYSAPFENIDYVQLLERQNDKQKEKSVFDYAYLLKACKGTGADFVLVIEDDTVMAEGWYRRTINALDLVSTEMTAMGRHPTNFLYLRLFYTEKFLGWSKEFNNSYITLSFLAMLFPLSLFVIPYFRRGKLVQRPAIILIIAFICIPMLIILFFLAGRPSMLPISRGVHLMHENACCTQAIVFPWSQISGLVRWLDEHGEADSYQDQLIEEYSKQTEPNMLRWALTPSVVQHIGDKSSKANSVSEWGGRGPRLRLWSTSFEREGKIWNFS